MRNRNKLQVIVRCNDFEEDYERVKAMGTIKYKLPMIDSYVIEVNESEMVDILKTQEILTYEVDTHITAQMKRASEIIEIKWAHDRHIYGENIGVAVVDTGIWLHDDFTIGSNRVIGFY